VVCDSKPLGFFLIKKYQPYPTVPTYHWEMGWKRLKWAENWLFISIHLSISIHIYPSWFTSETLCSTCPNSGTVQMRPSGRMPRSAPRTVSWPPMARWSLFRCIAASEGSNQICRFWILLQISPNVDTVWYICITFEEFGVNDMNIHIS
jgi:hypothetical protein